MVFHCIHCITAWRCENRNDAPRLPRARDHDARIRCRSVTDMMGARNIRRAENGSLRCTLRQPFVADNRLDRKHRIFKMAMSEPQKHGGRRLGAGRPPGSLNKRSTEAIEAVAARYPNWTPLLQFAAVANDESLPTEIRLDAAKAAAPFMHPRPKPFELDPEALIELEGRIAEVRAKAIAVQGVDPLAGLAERLDRAFRRDQEE